MHSCFHDTRHSVIATRCQEGHPPHLVRPVPHRNAEKRAPRPCTTPLDIREGLPCGVHVRRVDEFVAASLDEVSCLPCRPKG